MKAQMNWHSGMHFSCHNGEHTTQLDATAEHGGSGLAPTPKEIVLNAMMGCTAMDVVSILQKMRQTIKSFNMNIEVEKTAEHPIHFKSALLTYELTGELDSEKVKRAVDSSMTKYCGVNYMISRSCEIDYVVELNRAEIHRGKAFFEPLITSQSGSNL